MSKRAGAALVLALFAAPARAEERVVHLLWTGNPGPRAYLQQHGLLEAAVELDGGEILFSRMGAAWTDGRTVVYDGFGLDEDTAFRDLDCRFEDDARVYTTPQDVGWTESQALDWQRGLDLLSATTHHWRFNDGAYNRVRRTPARARAGRVFDAAGVAVARCLRVAGGAPGGAWRREKMVSYRVRRGAEEHTFHFMTRTYGGVDRVAAAVKAFRRRHPDGIVLSHGNTLGRMPEAVLPPARAAEYIRDLGFDAIAVGTWETAHYRWVKMAGGAPGMPPFLSANVHHDVGDAAYFEPHTILERGGLRLGIVGLTNPLVRNRFAMFQREATHVSNSPHLSARRSVRELHGKVDAVILLSNLLNLQNADVAIQSPGVDLVLGDYEEATSQRRAVTIEVSGRGDEIDKTPVHVSRISSRRGVTELTLTFRRADPAAAWSLARIHEVPVVLGPGSASDPAYRDLVEGFDRHLLGDQRVLISDPRELLGDRPDGTARLRLAESEFWTLGAEVLRERTRSEVGISNVRIHESDTIGAVTAGFVRDWIDGASELRVAYVRGSRLRRILEDWKARERRHARVPNEVVRLAVSGAESADTVRGFPLRDEDYYRVAFPSYFLDHPDEFPDFQGVDARDRFLERDGVLRESRAGGPVDVGALVLAWLESGVPDEDLGAALRGKPAADRALWRVDFRQIGFSLTEARVAKTNRFTQVRDSRVRAEESEQITGEAHLNSELLWRRYKVDADARVAFSRLRIETANQGVVVNEPIDIARFGLEGTYSFAGFPWSWLGTRWGPFLGFEYDTELTPVEGLPVKRIYRATFGPEIFAGSLFQKTQAGALLQRDAGRLSPKTQAGVFARSFAKKTVRSGTLESDFKSQYLFRTPTDEISDLLWEIDWKLRLKVPLWRHFTLNPFLDLFMFRAKSSSVVGRSAVFGFQVGFSRLWKPLEEPFWH